MKNSFTIKNMVCNRCIIAVTQIFQDQKIEIVSVSLGKVLVMNGLSVDEQSLAANLFLAGFELLKDRDQKMVNDIKAEITKMVFHDDSPIKGKFSSLLENNLKISYQTLSRKFSELEGCTIEKYLIKQRIERVKELLQYGELNLSEIAFNLGYSSVQHLSGQFKLITGETVSKFKQNSVEGNYDRKPIDQI